MRNAATPTPDRIETMRTVTSFLAAFAMSVAIPALAHAAPTTVIEPAPGEGANVPGMIYGVTVNSSCDGDFPFGRTDKGITLACVTIGEDDSGNTTRRWVRSVPLAGVRQPQSLCEKEYGMAALSPQKEAMLCTPQAKQGPPMWTVDAGI